MGERYKAVGHHPFFISPTIAGWINLFTRKKFCFIIMDSLQYCVKQKGLLLHEYVIMPSHLHLIIQNEEKNLPAIIRDFKAHTARQILKSLHNERNESRSEWILRLFRYYAKYQKQNTKYMVWQKTNRALELDNENIYNQKKEYIHQNPVKAGYVFRAEDWVHSSANDENELEDVLVGR